jgi:NADPH:quinone reductase-like Zn-dependent oxidoreductase
VVDFLVKRSDLRQCRVAESEAPEVGPGQALLRVESFGLTANNVTYAAMGEVMSYWDFFAADDGWGRMPVWGFAEVEQSEAEGVELGTRVFGYLPPSSHLLVTPVSVNEYRFTDGSPHRAELPSAYHHYATTSRDPFYRADTEELQMLLRPLFFTSFLIDDQLAAEGLTARGPILISSASSKTSIAAAFLLARRREAELIALTASRNREFVEGLGIYERTMAYEEIGSLERRPVTYVDVAGDALLRRSIHEHFGDDLIRSMVVGVTHWEGMRVGLGPVPGPAPTFFFAATRIEKRSADWGPAGLELRVAEAWRPFCEWTGGWLETIRGNGFGEIRGAYLDVLESRVDPRTAHVISLS